MIEQVTEHTGTRYDAWFHYGFRTRDAATEAALDAMAAGELSACEGVAVVPYRNTAGEWRFGVKVKGA